MSEREGLVEAGGGALQPDLAGVTFSEQGRARRSATHRWVFALTIAFLAAAALLRSVLDLGGEQRVEALTLLAVWLVLVLVDLAAERVWPAVFVVYLVAQGVVVCVLLGLSDSSDFFAVLFAVPVMQAMSRWRPLAVCLLVGVFAVLTGVAILDDFGASTPLVVAIYTAADVFFAAYALAARRSAEARTRNEALAGDLRAANERLAESARRAEQLGSARERQRLARDLHDSVTQTLFSMTLTSQSARLLLRRGPAEVTAQLDQIDDLAHTALAELAALDAELPASVPVEGGLLGALERHCAERRLRDGLVVTLEVDGDDLVPAQDEMALLRIAQEGLNNVVKHAGVRKAALRLRLRRPFRLEIEDAGSGFDPVQAQGAGLGLTSMRERAAEMGWSLQVTSTPGGGTRVVAEETVGEGGHGRG